MIEDKFESHLILINTIEKIKTFVDEVNKIDPDVDLIVNHYICDAKSILACFSVDVSRPIRVVLHSHEIDDLLAFRAICDEFPISDLPNK